MRPVAALFVRRDSVYHGMPGVDAWDEARDARGWPGGSPVVVHPPCGPWGRLRQFAKPDPGEKELAPLAVQWVRQFGGVLEHPAQSTLWKHSGLPAPSSGLVVVDRFGGWTLEAMQSRWGHLATKLTWFYIVGVDPEDLPPIPARPGGPITHYIRPPKSKKGKGRIQYLTKAQREETPPLLAAWLVEVARRSKASSV